MLIKDIYDESEINELIDELKKHNIFLGFSHQSINTNIEGVCKKLNNNFYIYINQNLNQNLNQLLLTLSHEMSHINEKGEINIAEDEVCDNGNKLVFNFHFDEVKDLINGDEKQIASISNSYDINKNVLMGYLMSKTGSNYDGNKLIKELNYEKIKNIGELWLSN